MASKVTYVFMIAVLQYLFGTGRCIINMLGKLPPLIIHGVRRVDLVVTGTQIGDIALGEVNLIGVDGKLQNMKNQKKY